jgi:hypothetical protein
MGHARPFAQAEKRQTGQGAEDDQTTNETET